MVGTRTVRTTSVFGITPRTKKYKGSDFFKVTDGGSKGAAERLNLTRAVTRTEKLMDETGDRVHVMLCTGESGENKGENFKQQME